MLIPYANIFTAAEETLKERSCLSDKSFLKEYSKFQKLTYRRKTDDDYFKILKHIIFFSGFKATIVNSKLETIDILLPDFRTMSSWGTKEVASVASKKEMIRNKLKITAVIDNAKTFKCIVEKYGSFYNFINLYDPMASFENLMLLKEDLEYRFKYLGRITVYHFLTEIGLEVLKPDRVLIRIFKRLALIEDDGQLLKTVIQGRKFSKETGKSIRYIDIIFVKLGQQGKLGICLEKNPKCAHCKLTSYCNYYNGLPLK